MTTILETQNLTFCYGTKSAAKTVAVDHVNLSIQAGECIGIIGRTGSGKSTLMQLLNGLLRPTSGSIFLQGKDIWAEPKKIRQVRFQVGLVFQYPEYQLFEETVEQDIAFGPRNQKLSEAEIAHRVTEALRFVGLPPSVRQTSPFDLSGGEKRRAAIAGVVAMDPEILVLDEPTAGLDPAGKALLLRQMMAYHQKRKNTILWVSHSMEEIAGIADRILVLDHGKVVLFDTVERVFAQSRLLSQMGLEVPQITAILTMLAERGYPVRRGIFTIEEAVAELLPLLKKGG